MVTTRAKAKRNFGSAATHTQNFSPPFIRKLKKTVLHVPTKPLMLHCCCRNSHQLSSELERHQGWGQPCLLCQWLPLPYLLCLVLLCLAETAVSLINQMSAANLSYLSFYGTTTNSRHSMYKEMVALLI